MDNEKTGDGQQATGGHFESKESAVKAAIAANPGATVGQIAETVHCHPRTAARWMNKLQAAVTN